MKSRNTAVVLSLALVAAVSFVAQAGSSYYLKSAGADWSQAESFATSPALSDSASTPPGADDDVYLLANTDVSLTSGTASFSTAAAVGRIVPQSGSRLLLTVDGEATFGAKINNGKTLAANDPYGEVVKLGDGVLTLTATSTIPNSTSLDFTYYIASVVVEKGTLKFPQHGCATHFYYGDVTVSNNATLYMPLSYDIKTGAAISSYMRMRSLCGEGLVTVDGSVTKVTRYIYLEKYDSSRRVSVFNGTISGAYVNLQVHGGLTVTNNASSFDGMTQVLDGSGSFGEDGSGILTTMSFGTVNKASPVGRGQFLSIGNYGGGFRYSGNGESTDKIFLIAPTVGFEGVAFLDAGPNGGVTFTGEFRNNTATEKHLVLMGSNTAACVLANSWMPSATGGYPIFTTKRGSGTWRFADVASRDHDNVGGFAVEDGVLQFTSISNIGERCSLGTATYLTRPIMGVPTAADMRVYAHTIGSTNAGANAVFDYVGSECAMVTNRPTVLVGTGAIRSSATGKGYLAMTDVSPRDDAAVTLVLDGTNTNHNVMRDIFDGTGVVSVVKRGSGEWMLSGDTRFSGSLRVEEGVLTVAGPRYTWFRLSFMEAGAGADDITGSTRGQIAIQQIGLYDAAGARQNLNLSYTPAYTSGDRQADATWPDLTPGSVKVGRPGTRSYAGVAHDLGKLFVDGYNDSVTIRYLTNDVGVVLHKDDPSSWIPIVMRLTNGVSEVVAYDIQTFFNNSIAKRWPKTVRMEGSRDGVAWDWLGDHEFDHSFSGNTKWLAKGSANSAGADGVKIRGASADAFVLSNVTSVAVSSGAVLRTFDDVMLSSIEVDCNDCGTIQGFSLAESGTLNIVNAPKSPTFSLPNFLSGVANAENLANWTLKIGGAVKKNWEISVSGTEVKISGPGFTVIVR